MDALNELAGLRPAAAERLSQLEATEAELLEVKVRGGGAGLEHVLQATVYRLPSSFPTQPSPAANENNGLP